MCGISGVWTKNASQSFLEKSAISMIDSLDHRGPDASGKWIDVENGLLFSHNRLAIQDLSSNGNQPMISKNRRYVIVFNGEIYNFQDLKKNNFNIKHLGFKSHSDTEVLLELIASVGLKNALDLIRGQFAFALWDKDLKELSFCRDRFGEKPLYIYHNNEAIFFASELSAFKNISGLELEICETGVKEFLSYGYINHPNSIFKNVEKLAPGSVKIYKNNKLNDCYKYFSIEQIHESKNKILTQPNIFDIENRLTNSIQNMLISDAPIGAFLSGGIDSSLVCAIAAKKLNRPIDTFSIGFEDYNHDESSHAEEVARSLNTKHHTFMFTDSDALNYIPKISKIFSEPFADSSQIPTLLLSKYTKQHVTVALSGDGGDELFLGYNRYRYALILDALKKLSLEKSVNFKKFLYITFPLLRAGNRLLLNKIPLLENKLEKISRVLESNSISDSYKQITQNGKNFFTWSEDIKERDLSFVDQDISALDYFVLNDLNAYLPEDILTKVDRSSMFHSLEVRAPFLDLELLNMSYSMNRSKKINFFSGKKVLKKILFKYLDKKMFARPKSGFSSPIDKWMRGPLKDWSSSMIQSATLKQFDFIEHSKLNQLLNNHTYSSEHSELLWNLCVLSSWLEEWEA